MPSLSLSLSKRLEADFRKPVKRAVERLSGPTGRRFKSQEVLQPLCSTSCWIEMCVIFFRSVCIGTAKQKSPVKPENTLKYKWIQRVTVSLPHWASQSSGHCYKITSAAVSTRAVNDNRTSEPRPPAITQIITVCLHCHCVLAFSVSV